MRKARALVLSTKPFSESSDVVYFLSEEGVESALALGRRRPSSQLRAALQPLNLVELVLLERRRGFLITQASLLRSWSHLTRESEKFLLVSEVLGFVKKWCPGAEGLLEPALEFLDNPEEARGVELARQAIKKCGYWPDEDELKALGFDEVEILQFFKGRSKPVLKTFEKYFRKIF